MHKMDADEGIKLSKPSLDASDDQAAEWMLALEQITSEFLKKLPSASAFGLTGQKDLAAFNREADQTKSFEDLARVVLSYQSDHGLLAASGRHLGFIPGGGLSVGAAADYLAALVNDFTGDAFASPISCEINRQVIAWLCDIVGYSEASFGDITSGGSQATLMALLVAREAHDLRPRDYHNHVVYLSDQTHHCLTKALRVVCGGDAIVRLIKADAHGMDTNELQRTIQEDLSLGHKPWVIAATAGTTNLGVVDPLKDIAAIAKAFGIWMHVDGAYGGFFNLCTKTSALFEGLEQADSIVLDPHKGMFLPYGSGALLVKDAALLVGAMAGDGAYLRDRRNPLDLPSPMDYSLELSRPFRALRLYIAIKLYGRSGFQNALEAKLLLARQLWQDLEKIPEITTYGEPSLSIVAFRHRDGTEASEALVSSINKSGKAFVSTTMIHGTLWIRAALMSFRTNADIVSDLLQVIRDDVEGSGRQRV